MNPLTIGLDVVGLGLQVAGLFGASGSAKQKAELSKSIAADEQRINEQKLQQAQFESRRMQLEVFRNMQRLRAQATAAATNQGASLGSGLQGGLAQITDQSLTNSAGIKGNLSFADTIFSLNQSISGKKMQMADVESDMAESQALMSLGGAMVKNSGTIGNLGQNFMGLLKNG